MSFFSIVAVLTLFNVIGTVMGQISLPHLLVPIF